MFHRTRKSKVSVFALVSGLSAVTALVSPQALAQGDAMEIEEVVVSGFRQSLEAALDQKRAAVGAVDSILAEDIAEFPDNNLAESLQRIPGVVIDRAGGEGRSVSVRGLGPNFSRTLINGMEVLASSGFTDALGGASRGRGFDYNTFDANLFRSLTVKKTSDAQTDEGSLGATIEMQSARPFDFNEFTLVASGQLGYNDLSEEVDPKFSVLAANTFADGAFGVLASVAFSERTLVEEGASSVRWANANPFGARDDNGTTIPFRIPIPGQTFDPNETDPDTAPAANQPPFYQLNPAWGDEGAALNDAFKPRLPRYDFYQHEIERTGANLALQFAPSDAVQLNLDVLYAKHEAFREERFAQAALNNGGIVSNVSNGEINEFAGDCSGVTCGITVMDYEIDSNNSLVYGVFENGRIASESRRDEMTTEFTQVTLSGQFDISDTVRLKALAGSAESNFDNPVQTSLNLQRDGADWSYDYRGGRVPNFDFGPDMQSLSGWNVASIRLRPITADNTFDTVAVDLEWDLDDNMTFKTGVSSKKYEFATTEFRRPSENTAGIGVVDASLMETIDGGNATWATVNFDAFLAAHNINSLPLAPRTQDTWGAEEETTSIYVQLDFEGNIGDVPVRGNIGVRQIDTDQDSRAFGSVGGTTGLVTGSHNYDDLLPSLNLVWETSDDTLIRFGWSKTIARAPLTNLRPNVDVSASGGARSVEGGNPALEPTRSTNYDLALEYYFAEESLFSMAVFAKDIESHVQEIGGTTSFANTGLDPQIAIDACAAAAQDAVNCGPTTLWDVTSPVNGPGGDLYGFEVSYQQPFTFLPGIWSNFGILANFTYVKSQLDYVEEDGTIIATRDLLNLSQNAHNATLYYEDDAFSARISFVRRSGYITQVPGRNGNDLEGVHPTNNVDLAASYTLSDQIKLTFEAQNLTDEADDHWVDQTADRPSFYHQSGTQYYFGVRFSL